jgi:thermitase
MAKKRLIVRIKENANYEASFSGILEKKETCKKVYTFQDDPFEKERNSPFEHLQAGNYLEISDYYRKLGSRQKEYYRTFKIDIDSEDEADSYLNSLNSSNEIEEVYFDGQVKISNNPNDIFFSKQQSLFKLQCEEAWDISNGKSNILISVIDTGILDSHEDLRNSIYVDTNGTSGFNFTNDKNNWDNYGEKGHGTGVAGIIAASWNNHLGVAGIAPNCKILNCKVFPQKSDTAFFTDCQNAIKVSIDNGAKILNCSWEIDDLVAYDNVKSKFIEFINSQSNEAVLVFAAGNSGKDISSSWWNRLENCLTVGALNLDDYIWNGSNYGRNVIFSYGSGIFGVTKNNKKYEVLDSGTSFAAPHVSGICGLILSYNPQISPKEVIKLIIDSRVKIPQINSYMGLGKVNALSALKLTQERYGKWINEIIS